MGQAGPHAEAELVEQARGGDAEAFRRLCAHYEAAIQARLRRVVTGPLKRKVSLADVMQEAYITAHQRLDEFEHRGDGAFGAWLTRIAELKAREAIRRYVGAEKRDVHRERSRGMRPDTAKFKGEGPTPSEVAIAHEERDDLHEALQSLPDDYRHVIQLVRFDGLTLKDTAVLMGRSHDAVKKLYGRALSRLADVLSADRGEARDE
jgi:RNA polymerase sigma-70 factor (ECF subfamily)